MKVILKYILIISMLQLIVVEQTYASSRMDDLIIQDDQAALDKIQVKQDLMKSYKRDLTRVSDQFQLSSNKGRPVYLRFETILGSAVIVGLIIGSYKAHIPAGTRAMAGAYVIVKGMNKGLVELKPSDVLKVQLQLLNLYNQISKYEKVLNDQRAHFCKSGVNHILCYK